MARDLEQLDLRVWSGSVEEGLAFVGGKARTLILSPVGRPWLPIDRLAEPHPVDVVVSGAADAEVVTGPHRVATRV